MSKAYPYIRSGETITIYIDGMPSVIAASHQNHAKILKAINEKNWDVIPDLVNIVVSAQKFCASTDVQIENGIVTYKGIQVDNILTKKMLSMMGAGEPIDYLIKFLDNLMLNPSYRSVEQLYPFLEIGGIPITENGTFLTYKRVRSDYKDYYSGTFDNSVGTTITMSRNLVNDDPNQTCSAGLHVCSFDYLDNFSTTPNDKIIVCEVNPKDVVAIPTDYNYTKMRVCEYTVIADISDKYKEARNILQEKAVLNTSECRTHCCAPKEEVKSQEVKVASDSAPKKDGKWQSNSAAIAQGKRVTKAMDANPDYRGSLEDCLSEVTQFIDDDTMKKMKTAWRGDDSVWLGKLFSKAFHLNQISANAIDAFISNLVSANDNAPSQCKRCKSESIGADGTCAECGYIH